MTIEKQPKNLEFKVNKEKLFLDPEFTTVDFDTLNLPDKYPFPYTPEVFTEEEEKTLRRFFSNTDKPVFAVFGLPDQVTGALFSRYSRLGGTLRRLFLDEFWNNKELALENIAGHLSQEDKELGMQAALKRAEKFYHTVKAQFGDDSVLQMGSVDIAFEYTSQIAAKAIEDGRPGAAFIEKSTRYINFGAEVDGHSLFMEVPEIMETEFAQEYLDWNKEIFEAYKRNIPVATEYIKSIYPLKEMEFSDAKSGEVLKYDDLSDDEEKKNARNAYNRAIRAKALDTIRVFLPTTTVTNLGAHLSGQAAEHMLNKLMASEHSEVRLMGALGLQELMKVVPAFLEEVPTQYGARARRYLRESRAAQSRVTEKYIDLVTPEVSSGQDIRIVEVEQDADVKIAAEILFKNQKTGVYHTKNAIYKSLQNIKTEDLKNNPDLWWSPRLVDIIVSAVPDRTKDGRNRRHKLPRAFEEAHVDVEFYTDFGIFRDLQRNRMSLTERGKLSAKDIFFPKEFAADEMKAVRDDYAKIARKTIELNQKLQDAGHESAAEYVTLLGNKLRYSINANFRQWVFFNELRTIPGGHPTYRNAMQEVTQKIVGYFPWMEPLFTHVDWTEDYGIGRLKGEIRTEKKLRELGIIRDEE